MNEYGLLINIESILFKGAWCIGNIYFYFRFNSGDISCTLAFLEDVGVGVHFLLDEVVVPIEDLVSLLCFFLFILLFLFGENG
jgi:hypothetical protein